MHKDATILRPKRLLSKLKLMLTNRDIYTHIHRYVHVYIHKYAIHLLITTQH